MTDFMELPRTLFMLNSLLLAVSRDAEVQEHAPSLFKILGHCEGKGQF